VEREYKEKCETSAVAEACRHSKSVQIWNLLDAKDQPAVEEAVEETFYNVKDGDNDYGSVIAPCIFSDSFASPLPTHILMDSSLDLENASPVPTGSLIAQSAVITASVSDSPVPKDRVHSSPYYDVSSPSGSYCSLSPSDSCYALESAFQAMGQHERLHNVALPASDSELSIDFFDPIDVPLLRPIRMTTSATISSSNINDTSPPPVNECARYAGASPSGQPTEDNFAIAVSPSGGSFERTGKGICESLIPEDTSVARRPALGALEQNVDIRPVKARKHGEGRPPDRARRGAGKENGV
jgi:hypothetical protein